MDLKTGKDYLIIWKGLFGNLHEYEGKFKRIEDEELVFEITGIGEMFFEEKEIKKIEGIK